MATIQLIDVTKTFTAEPKRDQPSGDAEHLPTGGLQRALAGVTLTIPDGQTMVIVGPSGCGKSTLLRTVAGLEEETSGQILYDGQPMANVPAGERHIGMVFQNYALYPHFAGQGNLAFFFRLRKATDAETEERIRITSEIMGFGFRQLLARKPGTLSGGQQQRLAIGRAIVRNPKLFLFDEPLSNLDAKLRTQTRIEIKRLLQRFGITAIYVTHDQTEAMALSDQVAVMRAGRVEQVGPFQSLLHRPINQFVAGFLGPTPMNLLTGGEVNAGHVALGDQMIALPTRLQNRLSPGERLTIGVRPEQVHAVEAGSDLATNGPENAHAEARVERGEATTRFIRYQGIAEIVEPDFGQQRQLIHLRTMGNSPHQLVAQASLAQQLFASHPVEVAFHPSQCYFFDGQSGKCLHHPQLNKEQS